MKQTKKIKKEERKKKKERENKTEETKRTRKKQGKHQISANNSTGCSYSKVTRKLAIIGVKYYAKSGLMIQLELYSTQG